MANMTIPTSRDIYLELNGKKLAVVQGYSAKALRTSREVEAIGDGVSFYELDDFSVVVCRPGKRIIYSHCRWSNIEELGKLGEPVAEKVTVISCKRMETDA